MLDLIAPEGREILKALVKTEGDGWLLPRFAPPAWDTIVCDMWGVTADDDVRWMVSRLGPTPFGHFKQPVRRTNALAEKLPRAYIRRLFPSARFDEHARMAQCTSNWLYGELAVSYHPAITAPAKLANLLAALAG